MSDKLIRLCHSSPVYCVEHATSQTGVVVAVVAAVYLHHKICVFIIYISFFDEVSNFRRILTNQKQELVV